MRIASALDRLEYLRRPARVIGLALFLLAIGASMALAATIGKIQGKVVSTDTGEPIGFADVALLPADSSLHPVGGLTNADGTYLLEAPPGLYALRIRALSYRPKRIESILIEAGKLLPISAALTLEAIEQKEIVVEGKRKDDNETALLVARRKASSVGDAVSAEQVRRTPDKDAAEVLRRVTGLSVADGKYVFVRGLGERYSSTEVDGVRIASPEQNKRVVPLDLLPASLLENIVIQKTYTADRPGEFGGGDVQVHTKDFPGHRTWQVSMSQGYAQGSTFKHRSTYAATRADIFGFGADSRKIPQAVYDVAGSRPLVESIDPQYGFPKSTLAEVGKSFRNVWSPISEQTIPNAAYSATYGDEFKLFGRPLGLIQSWNLNRSFTQRDEADRFFISETDTLYDYAVKRFQESVQLGGISGFSYRLSPRHTLHLRGLYTNSADDEVRTYQGPDHNRVDATTGTWLVHRNTRLLYVQRSVLSGTIEGQHDFTQLLGTRLDWKFTRSRATRLQPDRREYTYDRRYSYDANNNLIARWILGSTGSREFGDLKDNGWGTTVSAVLPYRLGPLGSGRLAVGYDRQTKDRSNFYRRFNLYPHANTDRKPPPEAVFDSSRFDGGPETAYVEEATLDIDNYRATQRVEATYLSTDVPFWGRVRGTFGVRFEEGSQDVRSYDLFKPDRITQHGALDNRDVLPSGNLTWAVTDVVNLRLGASRTVSRPDLNELSPSPSLEYVGGYQIAGNPNLRRAFIDNYDVRVEAFPALSEVLAAGFFYKYLREPIEQVIQGGSPPLLVPRNSDHGRNVGVEIEARAGLGRVWRRLNGLSVNSNVSFISSEVFLDPRTSGLNSKKHVLQGQANYLVNTALSFAPRNGRIDTALLLAATGERLMRLAEGPLGNIYEQPTTSLDATVNLSLFRSSRVKLAAKNLLDPKIRQLQGNQEVSAFRKGRAVSLAVSFGS
jgi:hypothetical protein